MTDNSYDEWITRQTLLNKVKNPGDEHAWSDFVFYYRKYIYNIVKRMGLKHHDAEEIVQTVLMKAWQKMPEFNYNPEKGRFRGWLCTVAGNEVRSYFRSKKNHHISMESAGTASMDEISSEYLITEPEIDKIAKEEWERYLPELAWKTISSQFEPQVLKTFEMFAEGVDASEISEQLGLSESSVYVYKKRVQDKLSAEISRLKKKLS